MGNRSRGRRLLALSLTVSGAACLAPWASATSDYLASAQLQYGSYYRGSLVLNCTLCHQREKGGGRLNRYGSEYGKTERGPLGFEAIQYRDSDRDGAINLYEFRCDTSPGDAESVPSPDEYQDARLMDWTAARVRDSGCFPGISRVRARKAPISARGAERLERALGRPLTPYERLCLQLTVRAETAERDEEVAAGAVYLIDTAGPSGPMQVVVSVSSLLSVAGVDIAFHNEPIPPPEEPTTPQAGTLPEEDVTTTAPPPDGPPPAEPEEGDGTSETPSPTGSDRPVDPKTGAIDLTGDGDDSEATYPIWPKRLAFEQSSVLRRYVGWTLGNEARWAEDLKPAIEKDPDNRVLYERMADAVRLALWLAEETMPRPTVEGDLGSVRHSVRDD